MKDKLLAFIKKETVLVAAIILAVISAFFVRPSAAYLDYIDWRVLGILLGLMIIMAGLQKNGVFDKVGSVLLSKTKNTLQLSMVLVFLCFFLSMLITNDVALLTFVPFAVLILDKCGESKLMIPVIILQTLAANLGSMLTPVGNPQNLYLYNISGMSLTEFIGCMLPYTIISGVLILLAILWICRKKKPVSTLSHHSSLQVSTPRKEKTVIYMILFVLSLLVVLRILPYYIVLPIIIVAVIIMDRKVLCQVDYCLLLTFIGFFIFTGNIGNISLIKDSLQQFVAGRELGIGILSSQFISNVPAALLLSGFTTDYKSLLEGVNIGGLGTLIASMASLISYKIYAQHNNSQKGKYFAWFTVVNIVFLLVLLVVALLFL